jgi:hypothetical protein
LAIDDIAIGLWPPTGYTIGIALILLIIPLL